MGKLQKFGVDVLFSYGEQQDFKDASKQIASAGQGGLGLPEKDYYLRKSAKDDEIRNQYVEHVAKMLVLAKSGKFKGGPGGGPPGAPGGPPPGVPGGPTK